MADGGPANENSIRKLAEDEQTRHDQRDDLPSIPAPSAASTTNVRGQAPAEAEPPPLPVQPHPVYIVQPPDQPVPVVVAQGALHESPPPPDFIILPEDLTILCALHREGLAINVSLISVRAAQLLRDKSIGQILRAAGLGIVSETKVGERLPLLIKAGLVRRPDGPKGRPTQRKGVGITPKGLEAIPAALRLTHR